MNAGMAWQTRALAGALAFLGAALWPAPGLAEGTAPSSAACGPSTLSIGGNGIWAEKRGAGTVTVVFEAGFGNDSSVWNGVEPRIRAMGVQTLVYDRAGMGHSTIDAGVAAGVDGDAHILLAVLADCGVRGPIVFVGHSYGGAIGLVAAARDPDIRGMVLLDAVVPGVWTGHEVQKNLAAMRPQYDEIRKQAPALAKVAIPWAEALPDNARVINALVLQEDLPIIYIAAEHGQTDPDSARTWRAAQTAFVSGHAARRLVLARGSTHKIMQDQPDLVVGAVGDMIRTVKASGGRPSVPAASSPR